jgi:hypothetical protein
MALLQQELPCLGTVKAKAAASSLKERICLAKGNEKVALKVSYAGF